MEIYFIQHCQLILQDSRLITIVQNQCTIGFFLWQRQHCLDWPWKLLKQWKVLMLMVMVIFLLHILFRKVWVRPCLGLSCCCSRAPAVAELTWNCIGNLYQVTLHNWGREGWWQIEPAGPAPPGLVTFSPPGTINQSRFCQQSAPGRHQGKNYLLSSSV